MEAIIVIGVVTIFFLVVCFVTEIVIRRNEIWRNNSDNNIYRMLLASKFEVVDEVFYIRKALHSRTAIEKKRILFSKYFELGGGLVIPQYTKSYKYLNKVYKSMKTRTYRVEKSIFGDEIVNTIIKK